MSEHSTAPKQPNVLTPQSRPVSTNSRTRIVAAAASIVTVLTLLTFAMLNSDSIKSVFAGSKAESPEQPSSSEPRRLPVQVQSAQFVDQITQKRRYTGIVRAKQQADLAFELTGQIKQILVDEGDVVARGEHLGFLDVRSLEARKSATIASLEQATAVLEELKAGPRKQTIDAMRSQLEEANSSLKLAELNFERRKNLQQAGAISESEYDEALYAYNAAQAKVDATTSQLNELEIGTRHEKITAQVAAVHQLESSISEIDVQIEKSTLVAPFDGKIVQRMADAGGIASASMPILKIVDVDNLEAVIGIPVETASHLDLNSELNIEVGSEKFGATLRAKIQQLDLATRTQNLIFQLNEQASETVIAGQLCEIEIATNVDAAGYWVLASSLNNGIRGLWSLMVVDPETSKAMHTDVQLIYTDGDRVLVDGPLENGSLVIVDGAHRIVSGQHVQPLTKLVVESVK